MKIISTFRDYYDSVSHQYLDKEIVYMRGQTLLNLDKAAIEKYPRIENSSRGFGTDNGLTAAAEIIGFCGKIYPVITIRFNKLTGFFYSYEELEKFVIENEVPIKPGKKRWLWRDSYDLSLLVECKRFLENTEKFKAMEYLFSDYNAPAFLYRISDNNRQIIFNPMLKFYNFVTVKDPFTAHQELYQYVSGHLKQPQKPMVEISDKDKIHKHGFDKWSFRKMPKDKK
jgi:hypothetical protein